MGYHISPGWEAVKGTRAIRALDVSSRQAWSAVKQLSRVADFDRNAWLC